MSASIVTRKSKYEDILTEIEYVQDNKHVKKDYHAFVYWFMATLFGKDEQAIKTALCDGTHDKGVDAVLIDKVERTVSVFQSKFEREGNKSQLKENEVKLLACVRDYFKSRSALAAATDKADSATQHLLEEAFQALSSGYTLELMFITTHRANPSVEPLLRDTLQFTQDQFRVFCYDNILAIMADKSRDFLPMNAPYNLPFRSADGSIVRSGQYNSWVLTVGANDLRNMAINYPDHLLFRKNVRDFLSSRSETNQRMFDTLRDSQEQKNFWFYNNGITILCNVAALNMEQKYIHLVDPEVINGCQTVTTIRKYKKDSEAEVLVRVVASQNQSFMDSMILYQNSSNPVSKRDLKSNDPVQVRLHHEFFKRRWFYEIKRGQDFDTLAKENRNIRDQCAFGGISNSEVAKALAAVKLHPSTAVAEGDEYFFGEAYEDIFTQDLSTSDCLAPYLLRRVIVRSYYSEHYHRFDKAFVFKNPGRYFVLCVLHKCMVDSEELKKKWVTFYENFGMETKEWNSFSRSIRPIINSLFDIAYQRWNKINKRTEINHNTFFKSADEVNKLLKEKGIPPVQKKACAIFEDLPPGK